MLTPGGDCMVTDSYALINMLHQAERLKVRTGGAVNHQDAETKARWIAHSVRPGYGQRVGVIGLMA